MSDPTVRLTVGQAIVRFLTAQHTERDGVRQRLFAGCLGIFGHGNVAGVGQALLESELADPRALPYVLARNEQGMVHTAVGFARMRNRLSTWACTASIGPGSTNMLTGAAVATTNRIPVLLLPSDVFATRPATPVLQELEEPRSGDISVNDAFRPLSRFFDRIWRPEQLPSALLGAVRVLTDQAETGAATIALPQDVQAEAHDWPLELFAERVWRIPRPLPEPGQLADAVDLIRRAQRPLIIAGGGVVYSDATEALRSFVEATGIPVGVTQAGKGALPFDHPSALGAIGSTGTTAANRIARDADVVIGIGTRYSDFTTASRTAFQHPGVRFVNINVTGADASKHGGVPVVADAREALTTLADALEGFDVGPAYREETRLLAQEWDDAVQRAYTLGHHPLPSQSEVIGAVNDISDPHDVVVCAAGSMPGDLHKLWRVREPSGYHVEYAFSCMGYEIAGGLGVAMAAPDRTVYVMVGDGSYLMMAQELVTAVQEGVKIVVVAVQNHGFQSIGGLSESVGSQRFGTRYRYRDEDSGRLEGARLPVDIATNAESLGVTVLRAEGIAELRAHLRAAKELRGPVMVHVETDPLVPSPDGDAWWDVPVAEVAELESTREARKTYETGKQRQRPLIGADAIPPGE